MYSLLTKVTPVSRVTLQISSATVTRTVAENGLVGADQPRYAIRVAIRSACE